MEHNVVYITHDLETSGPNTKTHDVLAIGACVVTKDVLSAEELQRQGLCFYVELKPQAPDWARFDPEAMKVACLELDGLSSDKKSDLSLDSRSQSFDPQKALRTLYYKGRAPQDAIVSFVRWVVRVTQEYPLIPIFDTSFFDAPFLKAYLDRFCDHPLHPFIRFPYSHRALDISSFWQGRAGVGRKLTEVIVQTHDLKEHHARDDAILIARIAQKLGVYSHAVIA